MAKEGLRSLAVAISLLVTIDRAWSQEDSQTSASGDVGQQSTLDAIPVAPQATVGEDAPTQDSESAVPAQFEEIIVTATKRAQSIREIPATINAIQGAALEQAGARELRDFITSVPGITLQDGRFSDVGTRKIIIRGVGPADTTVQSGNQTVGILIGDVPLTDPFSNFITPDLDPFDLKTVEILKGPQGTTFGASALNGAVRYVPTDPSFDGWEVRGFADHVSIDQGGAGMSYAVGLNAPFSESVAVRASGVLQKFPGLYDNLQRDREDADSKRKWSGRGQGKWKPTDATSLDLIYLKQRGKADDLLTADAGDGRRQTNYRPGPSTSEIGFELAVLDGRYRVEDLGTFVIQGAAQEKTSYADVDGAVAATGELGIETLRSAIDVTSKGKTIEGRLVSPDGGDWNWIAGAFHLRYDVVVFADAYAANTQALSMLEPILGVMFTPNGLSIARPHIDAIATESSLYGELTRRFATSWELTVGVRRFETKLDGISEIVGTTSAGQLGQSRKDISQKDDGLSPKLSLVYKPFESFMAYATVSRGFQFGGVNSPPTISFAVNNPLTGVPVPADFKSSVLWNREIGIRTDWFDRTLRGDLTYFNLDWSDAQFGQFSGGNVQNNPYIANVGNVRSWGLEGTMSWLTPLPGLSFTTAASYIRSKTAADFEDQNGVIPSGTEMPATPHVQLANTIGYNSRMGAWAVNGQLAHSYWAQAWNNINHEARIYDFNTFNVNLGVARADVIGAPELTLGIANITNKDVVYDRSVEKGAVAAYWVYGRPRTVNLRLSLQFN